MQRNFLPTHATYSAVATNVLLYVWYPIPLVHIEELTTANWSVSGLSGGATPTVGLTFENEIYLFFTNTSVTGPVIVSQLNEDPNANSITGYPCTVYSGLVATENKSLLGGKLDYPEIIKKWLEAQKNGHTDENPA